MTDTPTGSQGSDLKSDENKPRSLRFTFNSNTTSSKPPDDIVQEVINTCTMHDIKYRLPSRFVIECSLVDGLKFEVEICKLPRLKNLHGLRFRRLSGPANEYKDVCEKMLGSVAL
ncbi:KA1 domain/Ssp2 C-terminal domain-containing protein [Fimicolochytrium jonesii]|uniref:KA1 domain/Ssp2 C-terminal domain-containing protein n=1 Tax=Fimicolochytrium jonesii TaxID=1396493 RepID=UPI0022FEB7F7|nr:KA1 domain/Ssp2 C-terminal domain-containing protein [Fimicolochytrium jonesii]KAI8818708.1 KA1 domain/Ssp2 C-terminal domain-containing protein [Fimicolochytrium jonesii]